MNHLSDRIVSTHRFGIAIGKICLRTLKRHYAISTRRHHLIIELAVRGGRKLHKLPGTIGQWNAVNISSRRRISRIRIGGVCRSIPDRSLNLRSVVAQSNFDWRGWTWYYGERLTQQINATHCRRRHVSPHCAWSQPVSPRWNAFNDHRFIIRPTRWSKPNHVLRSKIIRRGHLHVQIGSQPANGKTTRAAIDGRRGSSRIRVAEFFRDLDADRTISPQNETRNFYRRARDRNVYRTAGGILPKRCCFHHIISVGQRTLDSLFARVVAERIFWTAMSAHRNGNVHSIVHFAVDHWNSDRIIGLASDRQFGFEGLPGSELNRSRRTKIGHSGIIDRRESILLAANLCVGRIVVHHFAGHNLVGTGRKLGKAKFSIRVRAGLSAGCPAQCALLHSPEENLHSNAYCRLASRKDHSSFDDRFRNERDRHLTARHRLRLPRLIRTIQEPRLASCQK